VREKEKLESDGVTDREEQGACSKQTHQESCRCEEVWDSRQRTKAGDRGRGYRSPEERRWKSPVTERKQWNHRDSDRTGDTRTKLRKGSAGLRGRRERINK